jgi:GMP synthase (glutamine-hydrolysing)
VQALAAGPAIRGVQWHPEFSGAIVGAYVETRAEALSADAAAREAPDDHPSRLRARARDTPWGAKVLDNFVERFVLGLAVP